MIPEIEADLVAMMRRASALGRAALRTAPCSMRMFPGSAPTIGESRQGVPAAPGIHRATRRPRKDMWRINVVQLKRPNALRFTRAALIDRDVFVANSGAQNRPDLVDA